jgi:hypothetical protein
MILPNDLADGGSFQLPTHHHSRTQGTIRRFGLVENGFLFASFVSKLFAKLKARVRAVL